MARRLRLDLIAAAESYCEREVNDGYSKDGNKEEDSSLHIIVLALQKALQHFEKKQGARE